MYTSDFRKFSFRTSTIWQDKRIVCKLGIDNLFLAGSRVIKKIKEKNVGNFKQTKLSRRSSYR